MRIHLDLKRHCIETEIKRRHEAAISRYFKKVGEKKQTERELMLLEDALKAFVFHELRNRWPILAGGEEGEVYLTQDEEGILCLVAGCYCIRPPFDEG
jgi:hypothetical protein